MEESSFFKVEFELAIFGSFANGLFSSRSSDLDLTLIIDQKLNHEDVLKTTYESLKAYRGSDYKVTLLNPPFWNRGGCILSFELTSLLTDKVKTLQVDILVNKFLEL